MYHTQTRRIVSRLKTIYYETTFKRCMKRIEKRVLHQTPLHAATSHPFHTQTLLHIDAFTRRLLYTQTLLRTDAFIYRPFYTDAFTHTCSEISYRITDVECIVGAKTLQSNLTGVNERSVVETYEGNHYNSF